MPEDWCDRSDVLQPLTDSLSGKLRAIVRADELRGTSLNEQVAETFKNILARNPSCDIDHKVPANGPIQSAFAAIFQKD